MLCQAFGCAEISAPPGTILQKRRLFDVRSTHSPRIPTDVVDLCRVSSPSRRYDTCSFYAVMLLATQARDEAWRKTLLVCTLSDTKHVALGGVTVLLMFLAIAVGATAFGKGFRLYSVASIVVLLAFGALTFWEAPRLQANLLTPWIGLWERINNQRVPAVGRGGGDGAVAEGTMAVTTVWRDARDDVRVARITVA